jgi:hypothetical protein
MSKAKRKAYVSIYCKIYAENFSNEMLDREATGKEIYNFLMKDAGLCLPLHGDSNIWYLGSNEKFGNIVYKDKTWRWSFGEASFDIVKEFVRAVYDDGLFTEEQYRNLLAKIREGCQISDMYFIGDYLYKKNKPTTNTEKENSYVI